MASQITSLTIVLMASNAEKVSIWWRHHEYRNTEYRSCVSITFALPEITLIMNGLLTPIKNIFMFKHILIEFERRWKALRQHKGKNVECSQFQIKKKYLNAVKFLSYISYE